MNTRKIFCVIAAVMMLSCPAWADILEIHRGNAEAFLLQRDLGNSVGFRSYEGLQVVYMGTFRAKHSGQMKLDIKEGFDTRTNKFSWRASDCGYIAETIEFDELEVKSLEA